MRTLFFFFQIFSLITCCYIQLANSTQFSGDVTLEIFAFQAREDISCQALFIADPTIFKDTKPFAREKADMTNHGGSVSFLLGSISPKTDIIIFVRAINLATNTIYALGCMENIRATAGEQKEIYLYLTPQSTPA